MADEEDERVERVTQFDAWHVGYPVHVGYGSKRGRRMLSSKDVSANEVILADFPYVWIVDDNAKEYVCQNCFLEKDDSPDENGNGGGGGGDGGVSADGSSSRDYLPCQDCGQVYYCCEECKDVDFPQHTQDECGVFKAMETQEYSPAIITEMKLLVRTVSRKSVEPLWDQLAEQESANPNDNAIRYSDYSELISNRENFPQATIESLDYWICDYVRRLGEWVGGRTETNIELLEILLKNRCNAFYIQGRLSDEAVAKGKQGLSRGCGIYVRNSFFNHSCIPNVNYWVVENTLRVECTASNEVKKGQELNISYIDTTMDLAARREKLLESYLFTCDCPRCLREDQLAHGEPDESINENHNADNV